MSVVAKEVHYYQRVDPKDVFSANLHPINFALITDQLPWLTKEDFLPEGMPVNYALMICNKINREIRVSYFYFLDSFSRKECGC